MMGKSIKAIWEKVKRKDEEQWLSHGMRKWEYRRQQGKTKFVWRLVIALAVIPPLITTAIVWVEANGLSLSGVTPKHFYGDLISRILAGAITGWISGRRVWKRNEQRYEKTLNKGQT